MSRISLIAALTNTRAIGKEHGLVHVIPDDLKRFKELTTGHTVVMGRKTWGSLPEKYRPLPNRVNIVVSRAPDYTAPGAVVVSSVPEALERTKDEEEVFIIGGGELYAATLPLADRLYLTLIDSDVDGDIHFPPYEEDFTKVLFEEKREFNGMEYRWVDLERA